MCFPTFSIFFIINRSNSNDGWYSRKVDFRLLPILAALYSISIVDRINMGSAAVAGMTVDLKLYIGNRYSIILMVFFIPVRKF